MRISAQMITIDCADARALSAWWAEALGVEVAQDYGEFVVLAAAPLVLGFQQVPEPKAAKNRVHVDFSSEDRAAEVARLVELGATVVAEHTAPGLAWTTLMDPQDNEFCVSDAGGH
ncbi:Glyoxalase-like domain protein [Streptomyces sp. ADI96-02]|uniref:VOC family protein n=1 Tax=unclassified Streptomyces TaxID=2593676 RepID=UPI000F553DBB|nr:VOC family protein [Streptomyces sp. ADI96-02]RPK64620.1 Glyoxalase-like domain protein [Streptomyces sp. ADI96-02]